MPIGDPDLFFLIPMLIAIGPMVVGPIVGLVLFWRSLRRRARSLGYASTRAYLRASPRSDAERRDAADLALKGGVCCVLGFLIPTLVLVGLVPLFYGGRKLTFAALGLGLVDDPDHPVA